MQGYLLETGRQTKKREDIRRPRLGPPPPRRGGVKGERADRHMHIHIRIYNLCMYVASTHGSRCCSHIKAAQAFGLAMATHRLSLLCRATRRLSPYIHQLIREYLVVRVGVICRHVDDMLWRYVRQRGVFSFVLSGAIRPGIRKKKPLPDMGADLDAVEPEAEDLLEVEVRMRGRDSH